MALPEGNQKRRLNRLNTVLALSFLSLASCSAQPPDDTRRPSQEGQVGQPEQLQADLLQFYSLFNLVGEPKHTIDPQDTNIQVVEPAKINGVVGPDIVIISDKSITVDSGSLQKMYAFLDEVAKSNGAYSGISPANGNSVKLNMAPTPHDTNRLIIALTDHVKTGEIWGKTSSSGIGLSESQTAMSYLKLNLHDKSKNSDVRRTAAVTKLLGILLVSTTDATGETHLSGENVNIFMAGVLGWAMALKIHGASYKQYKQIIEEGIYTDAHSGNLLVQATAVDEGFWDRIPNDIHAPIRVYRSNVRKQNGGGGAGSDGAGDFNRQAHVARSQGVQSENRSQITVAKSQGTQRGGLARK